MSIRIVGVGRGWTAMQKGAVAEDVDIESRIGVDE